MLTEYDEDELSFSLRCRREPSWRSQDTANKGAGDHFGDIVCECWSYVAESPNMVETSFENVRNVRVKGEIFIKYDAKDLDAVRQRNRCSGDVNGVEV